MKNGLKAKKEGIELKIMNKSIALILIIYFLFILNIFFW